MKVFFGSFNLSAIVKEVPAARIRISHVHESSGKFKWSSGFRERRRVLRARLSDDPSLRRLRLQGVSRRIESFARKRSIKVIQEKLFV